jgi:hypothetical protein
MLVRRICLVASGDSPGWSHDNEALEDASDISSESVDPAEFSFLKSRFRLLWLSDSLAGTSLNSTSLSYMLERGRRLREFPV